MARMVSDDSTRQGPKGRPVLYVLIGSLVLLDVNGRVAHLLLRMAEDEGGDRITRKLTHHTIAQMIGSSRETVSRTMRNLVERGIIQVTRKEITLRDRRSLMLAARRA